MRRITFPFPLADGTIAFLDLPDTFTDADAERLCAMVRTLPMPEGERER